VDEGEEGREGERRCAPQGRKNDKVAQTQRKEKERKETLSESYKGGEKGEQKGGGKAFTAGEEKGRGVSPKTREEYELFMESDRIRKKRRAASMFIEREKEGRK